MAPCIANRFGLSLLFLSPQERRWAETDRPGRRFRWAEDRFLSVAEFTFADAPAIAILVIPGGFGTRALLDDREVRGWLEIKAKEAEFVTSVCTGALLLARAGLLRKRRATTHFGALDLLAEMDASITVERRERVVRDDDFITSAGVAAGIDMALSVVEILHGKEVANDTARYLEFPRTRYSVALTDAG